MEGNVEFDRETEGSTDWGAGNQRVAPYYSTGSALQVGLMEQLSVRQQIPAVTLTAPEVPAKIRPR